MAKSAAKKKKGIRAKLLETLTRQQLIALAKQKTEMPYADILRLDSESLATVLSDVPNVLAPEKAQ